MILLLIANAERVARLDGGGTLSPQLRHMREVLQPVAMSRERQRRVRDGAVLRAWCPDEIPTGEAAQMLDKSPRQVQRLAAAGAFGRVRRVGRGYLIPRSEVTAYAVHTRKETA